MVKKLQVRLRERHNNRDGMKLSRKGHQTHPYRYDGTLFFREGGLLWAWEPAQ